MSVSWLINGGDPNHLPTPSIPPKTNTGENRWLEDYFPVKKVTLFQGQLVKWPHSWRKGWKLNNSTMDRG